MEYIACISYGKDSLAMLEVIAEHSLPLDRIIHVEIMATRNYSCGSSTDDGIQGESGLKLSRTDMGNQ